MSPDHITAGASNRTLISTWHIIWSSYVRLVRCFIVKAPAISVLSFMMGVRYIFSSLEEALFEAVGPMKLSQNKRNQF